MLYIVATAVVINVAILIASIIYSAYKSIRKWYRKRVWTKANEEMKVKRAKELERK